MAGWSGSCRNRGRFAEAEEIGKKMLELHSNNTMALSALAQVAAMQTDDARATGYRAHSTGIG
jgi:hypothetical protein